MFVFLRLIQCVNGAVFLQLLRCSGQEGSLRRYDPKQVAVFHGQGQIVGREQDTFFFFPGELAKQPGYRPFIGDIQKSRRFVQQQHGCVLHQGTGNGYPVKFSVGQSRTVASGQMQRVCLFQGFGDGLFTLPVVYTQPVGIAVPAGADRVPYGKMRRT